MWANTMLFSMSIFNYTAVSPKQKIGFSYNWKSNNETRKTIHYLTGLFPAAHGRFEWALHRRYEGPTRCRLLLLPPGKACRTTRDLPSLPLFPHTEPRLHCALRWLGPSCRQYQGSCWFRSKVLIFKIDYFTSSYCIYQDLKGHNPLPWPCSIDLPRAQF